MAQEPPNTSSASPDSVPNVAPAGFWIRVAAAMIDSSVISIITVPFGFAAGFGGALIDFESIWLNITLRVVSFIAGFAYTALFLKYRGATPGKLLLGLRVFDADTGLYLGFWRTALREYVGKIVGAILLLAGFIMIGVRRDKRGLHDLIANTRVLRVE